MTQLHGVITSMLTPFTEALALDEETLAQELDHQLSKGVHGLCVLGGTGESLSLTPEERERAVEVSVRVVNGRVPIIVGCFVPQEEEIVAFAARVEDLGATALMLTPPAFYKTTPSQFHKLLERLTSRCSLPLVVYNAPGRAAVKLSADAVTQYVNDFPQIIGVKDAAADIVELARQGQAYGSRCALLQGMDDIFLPSLAVGASGGILAMASVVPEMFVEIYDSWRNGHTQQAMERQLSLVPVMRTVGREPMPVLVKEAMKVVGRPMGPTRPPLYEPDEENRRAMWQAMEKLLSA